jgi:hypothetical protein
MFAILPLKESAQEVKYVKSFGSCLVITSDIIASIGHALHRIHDCGVCDSSHFQVAVPDAARLRSFAITINVRMIEAKSPAKKPVNPESHN